MKRLTLIETLILLAVMLIIFPGLSGCAATYEVQRCEGTVCSFAKITSRREFANGLEILYDGEKRTFEFRANKVDTNISPLEIAAAQILTSLPALLAGPVPGSPLTSQE